MNTDTDYTLSKGLKSNIVMFAQDIVRSQRSLILSYQMDNVAYKADGSPVTIIDQQVEKNIKQELLQHFPNDEIVGEEYGTISRATNSITTNSVMTPRQSRTITDSTAPMETPMPTNAKVPTTPTPTTPPHSTTTHQYTWYVDPIDGTFAFINRIPLYTTLLALYRGTEPCFGIIYNPFFDEMLVGINGHGCHLNGNAVNIPPYASSTNLTMLCSDFAMLAHAHPSQFQKLCRFSHNGRTWCDAYGIIMLVTGRADMMIDFGLKPWDTAALYPVVSEANGWISDFSGAFAHTAPTLIACRKNLEGELLDICKSL